MNKIAITILATANVIFINGCNQEKETGVVIPDIIHAGQNFTGKDSIKYPTHNAQDCEDPEGCVEIIDVCGLAAFADSLAITQGNGQTNLKIYDSECIGIDYENPYATVDATVDILGVIAGSPLNRKEKVFFDSGVHQNCASGTSILSLRIQNGYKTVRGCTPIEMVTSESLLQNQQDINLLPNNFEELSIESQGVIGRYLSACMEDWHINKEDYESGLEFFSRRNSFIESASNCEEIPPEELSPPDEGPLDDDG